jgi:hypothetical protein
MGQIHRTGCSLDYSMTAADQLGMTETAHLSMAAGVSLSDEHDRSFTARRREHLITDVLQLKDTNRC